MTNKARFKIPKIQIKSSHFKQKQSKNMFGGSIKVKKIVLLPTQLSNGNLSNILTL